MKKHHTSATLKRIRRVRSKIIGTITRPRLSVDRSNKHLAAQLIDDTAHRTIMGLNTMAIKEGKTKVEKSITLGTQLAKQAFEKNIKAATLDRGQFRFGGRIKAFTQAANKAGLKI